MVYTTIISKVGDIYHLCGFVIQLLGDMRIMYLTRIARILECAGIQNELEFQICDVYRMCEYVSFLKCWCFIGAKCSVAT